VWKSIDGESECCSGCEMVVSSELHIARSLLWWILVAVRGGSAYLLNLTVTI
jgi:hypothetical protein